MIAVLTDRLNLHQLLPTSHHHLSHLLQANFELAECLFCITIGTILNTSRILTAPLDEGLTLLLGLLAELQGVVVQPLRFIASFLLSSVNCGWTEFKSRRFAWALFAFSEIA